jgi:hypothetical protein
MVMMVMECSHRHKGKDIRHKGKGIRGKASLRSDKSKLLPAGRQVSHITISKRAYTKGSVKTDGSITKQFDLFKNHVGENTVVAYIEVCIVR